MQRHLYGLIGILVATTLSATPVSANGCGSVTIAEINWASAELMANVDAYILEHGYDCDVELVPGATMPTFMSMNEKGEPDIAGELWVNAFREPLGKALDEGRLHSVIAGPITGLGEGWWVPSYTLEQNPELKTVEDFLERPDLFPHHEDSSKGAFYGCPSGWGCQLTNANMYRAFGMEEKGWLLVDPGSSAGLDGAIAKAVERGDNWFGYYWAPTAIVGKYNLQLLPFEVQFAGSENWDGCIVKAEQDCADPKPSAWTKSEVHTVITDALMQRGGAAVDFLSKRVFPGPVMNAMLVHMEEEQAGGMDAAIEFLVRYEDVWTEWVSEEVAEKVKASL